MLTNEEITPLSQLSHLLRLYRLFFLTSSPRLKAELRRCCDHELPGGGKCPLRSARDHRQGQAPRLRHAGHLKGSHGDTFIEKQTERTLSPALLESLQAIPGVSEVAQQDSLLQVKVDGEQVAIDEVVNLVTQQSGLASITQRESNLDEVFLSLTGRTLRD
jgi:hypothetical protein